MLTLEEATEEMKLGKGTLKTWISRKRMPIPFIRINGVIRIRRSDIDAFLEKNTVRHDLLKEQSKNKDIPEEKAGGKGVSGEQPKKRGRKQRVVDLVKISESCSK